MKQQNFTEGLGLILLSSDYYNYEWLSLYYYEWLSLYYYIITKQFQILVQILVQIMIKIAVMMFQQKYSPNPFNQSAAYFLRNLCSYHGW